MLGVRLVGELELRDGDRVVPLPASRKTRALFVYLLQIRKPVRRERLCEIFFAVPDDPRAALRWSLSKIRSMLGPFSDLLVTDRERVELRASGITTDVDRFRSWLGGAAIPGDPSFHADAALEPPLPGLELSGLDSWNIWLAAERAELDQVRGRFLVRVAQDESLTPEHRRLLLREATGLSVDAPVGVSTGGGPEDAPAPHLAASIEQHVHYCLSPDGVRIAYACTGSGPPLVKAANWLNHLELDWSGPVWGRMFSELSRSHSLVRYDERGNGLSDWDVEDISLDAFVRDLETVVDGIGLERFPLLGISQGCAVSIEYAARHPSRVSHLILLGGYAAGWRHTADAAEAEQREAVITLAQHGWGQDNPVYRQIFSQTFMPSATKEELDWFNEFQRLTATPNNAVRFLKAFAEIDVRGRLPQIEAPTLILHARGDQRVGIYHAIELASAIRGASLVTLDTDSHILLSREPATTQAIECISSFIRGEERIKPAG